MSERLFTEPITSLGLQGWGDRGKMKGTIVLLVDKISVLVGMDVYIHCGAETRAGGGYHPLGLAADFHFHCRGAIPVVPYPRQIDLVQRALDDLQVADIVGLGLYPDWTFLSTGHPCPGFHLDDRGSMARWGKIATHPDYVSYELAKEYALKKFGGA